MQKDLFSSNSFHQMFSLGSPKARAAASSASFSCIKSVRFLQPLSYSWTTKHTNRFVLAHTAFSRAYKINSVRSLYRLTCLRTNTHITTHGHCFLAQCFSPSLPPCLTSVPRRSSGALPCQLKVGTFSTIRDKLVHCSLVGLLQPLLLLLLNPCCYGELKNWPCQSLGR